MSTMRERARALWAQPGRWPRLLVIAACALIATLYCTNDDMGRDPHSPRGDGTYRPVLARGDGHNMYLMARSTALDGDWVFDNDLARFGDVWKQPRTQTGRKGIPMPIGPALVWTPLIWTAHAGAAVVNVVGGDIEMHGYTPWHQRCVFLSSVVFACGAVLLGLRLAKRFVGGAWAPSYAAVAILLGTSLTYYATHMPSYSHAMDAFACAAFLAYWALTLGRRDVRRHVLLGVLLGIAALIRVQELALGIVVAVEVVVESVRAARARDVRTTLRWLGSGALVLAVALVVFTPQLYAWHVVYGDAFAIPQGKYFTRFEAPMIAELLFSSRNGWFSTTPIAYLAMIGLVLVPRPARFVAGCLLAAVAIQVYLNSTIIDWWAGASFGQRRMCNVTVVLVVGLAALIWRLGGLAARARRVPRGVWHGVLVVLLGALVAWNVSRVWKLRGGKTAPSQPRATCCADVPSPVRGVAQWFYDRIGNPFVFPANAVFALRHDVDLKRWDLAVGKYPVEGHLEWLADDRLYKHRGTWPIGSPGSEPYIVGGLSRPASAGGRTFRATTAPAATVLVPNLMPYDQRLTLWLAPSTAARATVRWNGDVVATADLVGWTAVTWTLRDVELHTNELTIEATGTVQVGDLQLELLKQE